MTNGAASKPNICAIYSTIYSEFQATLPQTILGRSNIFGAAVRLMLLKQICSYQVIYLV
jgi:hypothetical protein